MEYIIQHWKKIIFALFGVGAVTLGAGYSNPRVVAYLTSPSFTDPTLGGTTTTIDSTNLIVSSISRFTSTSTFEHTTMTEGIIGSYFTSSSPAIFDGGAYNVYAKDSNGNKALFAQFRGCNVDNTAGAVIGAPCFYGMDSGVLTPTFYANPESATNQVLFGTLAPNVKMTLAPDAAAIGFESVTQYTPSTIVASSTEFSGNTMDISLSSVPWFMVENFTNADDFIVLYNSTTTAQFNQDNGTFTEGRVVYLRVKEAHEVRTPSGTNQTINGVDSDGTNELAIPAGSLIKFYDIGGGWIATGWGSNGAALTLTPDAA